MITFSDQIFDQVQPNQQLMTAYQTVIDGKTITDFDALKELYSDRLRQLPFDLRQTKGHLMNHQQRIVGLTTAFQFRNRFRQTTAVDSNLIRQCLLFKQSINADGNRYPPIGQFADLKTMEQLVKYEDWIETTNGDRTTYGIYRNNQFDAVTIDDLKAYFDAYLSLNVLTEISMLQTVFETEPK